jgi:hypothetical protein
VTEAEHLVVTQGTLLRDERMEVVIQALHLLQHVHRANVGLNVVVPSSTAPYREALQRLVRGLRVAQTQFIDAECEQRASLAHASCFVSACATRRAPGLRDAIAAALPTIATSNKPIAGSLVLPPDAGPLLVAEAILAVINDRGLRSTIVNAGRDSTSHGS